MFQNQRFCLTLELPEVGVMKCYFYAVFYSTFNLNIAAIYVFDLARFTVTASYYSLSFNTAQLHADPYISCFLSAVVEIPAYISSWVALRYLPRRLSVIGCFLLGAVSLYFIQLVPEGKQKKIWWMSVSLPLFPLNVQTLMQITPCMWTHHYMT